MIISNKQLSIISEYRKEQFVLLSIQFLKQNFPIWVGDKEEKVLREFIGGIILFGERHNIKGGINLQKLMHYQIEKKFDDPMHPELLKAIADKGVNENKRVEDFFLVLYGERYNKAEIFIHDIIK